MIYAWECDCGFKADVWADMDMRDVVRPKHRCNRNMHRLPGGIGLLYFEEGRARTHIALSDRPITSKKQHERLMRAAGVVEVGNNIPKRIRDNPQHPKMKELVAGTPKGRWI